MIDVSLLLEVGGMVAAAGVAWGGARAGAASATADLREFRDDFKRHCAADMITNERVVRVETLVQAVYGATVLKRREGDDS